MIFPDKHSFDGATIFSVMSALATQHQAINLSQGFPDFALDERLAALLGEAAGKGFNQYAPMPGLPLLREAIAHSLHKRYALQVDADNEITVTPGATYAIYTAFTALLRPGDEVVVLEPAYDSYIPNIEMNGAIAVPVALEAPAFNVDWDRVRAALTARTRAIIINTPHNPCGAVWQQADWDELASLVRNTDIAIVSDEVYDQLVFDGKRHISVLQHAELRERSFAIYSFGKVYNNTGWKIGYCIAPPAYTRAFRKVHQFMAFCVNMPAQYALAHHMAQEQIVPVGTLMERKRDYFLQLLAKTPFRIFHPAGGSYFQIAGYEQISDLPDMDFARWLTTEYGVATIPLSPFYKNRKDDKLVRLCFAKKESTLEEAAARLMRLNSR